MIARPFYLGEAEVSCCHWLLSFHSCLLINRKGDLQGQISILYIISPLGASPMLLVLQTVHTTADRVLSECLRGEHKVPL